MSSRPVPHRGPAASLNILFVRFFLGFETASSSLLALRSGQLFVKTGTDLLLFSADVMLLSQDVIL
jgi:hypothetical protein